MVGGDRETVESRPVRCWRSSRQTRFRATREHPSPPSTRRWRTVASVSSRQSGAVAPKNPTAQVPHQVCRLRCRETCCAAREQGPEGRSPRSEAGRPPEAWFVVAAGKRVAVLCSRNAVPRVRLEVGGDNGPRLRARTAGSSRLPWTATTPTTFAERCPATPRLGPSVWDELAPR